MFAKVFIPEHQPKALENCERRTSAFLYALPLSAEWESDVASQKSLAFHVLRDEESSLAPRKPHQAQRHRSMSTLRHAPWLRFSRNETGPPGSESAFSQYCSRSDLLSERGGQGGERSGQPEQCVDLRPSRGIRLFQTQGLYGVLETLERLV